MNEKNLPSIDSQDGTSPVDTVFANSQFPGASAKPVKLPPVTTAIMVICGAIWAALNFLPKGGEAHSLAQGLAQDSTSIWAGAYWALITSAFVHIDVLHGLFNMWWTKDFGKLMEPRLGTAKFVLFVLVSAVVSSGWQLAFSDQTGIGFSGVVYAFFGYMLATRHREPAYARFVDARTVRWLIGWFFVCIALTWAKLWNVGNAAHGAGLVFGFLVGVSTGPGRFMLPARYAALLTGACGLIPAFYMPWSPTWRAREGMQQVVEIEKAARLGDPQAQLAYSEIRFGNAEWYKINDGRKASDPVVADCEKEAWELLRKSAEQAYLPAMNNLAWKLATHDRKEIRNGKEALVWAEKSCEQDQWGSAAYIDTLAAAHAELRQWDQALAYELLAIRQLKPAESTWKERMEKRAEEYRRTMAPNDEASGK